MLQHKSYLQIMFSYHKVTKTTQILKNSNCFENNNLWLYISQKIQCELKVLRLKVYYYIWTGFSIITK